MAKEDGDGEGIAQDAEEAERREEERVEEGLERTAGQSELLLGQTYRRGVHAPMG